MKPLSSAALAASFLSNLSPIFSSASISDPDSWSPSPSLPPPPLPPPLSISSSTSTSTSSNKTLHISALTNRPDPPYLARVQCWALAAPFAVYPTVGRALALGAVDNATYVVLPPRSAEGWHRPPHAMFFVLLSGLAQVYVPRRRHHGGSVGREEDSSLASDGYGNVRAYGYDYEYDYGPGYERRFDGPGSRQDMGSNLDMRLDRGKHGGQSGDDDDDDDGGLDPSLRSPRSDSSSSSSSSLPRRDHHKQNQQQPLLHDQRQHPHSQPQLQPQPHPDDPRWDAITIAPGSPQQILVAADTDPRARGHLTFYPGDGETVALQIPFRDGAVGPAHTVVHEGPCRGDE